MTLGVGILGAGPVVQAIHLPTLARLRDRFAVRSIMDVDGAVAESVAGRAGATSTTSVEEVLSDESVEVVAICSPGRFHAAQAIAAMRAGKRAVLCEKPLAESREEALEIESVSAETGVPVIVGAMHVHDPGWRAAIAAWDEVGERAHTVRSSISIPPNDRFEDWATEILARPAFPAMDLSDPDARAGMIQSAVLGLAIHDLPLVRRLAGGGTRVDVAAAELAQPFGYRIAGSVDGTLVQLIGGLTPTWLPAWTLDAYSDRAHLHVDFTPSYVHAGSAVGSVTSDGETRTFGPSLQNGYENEWLAVDALVHGRESHAPGLREVLDDLVFAVDIASTAADLVRGEGR